MIVVTSITIEREEQRYNPSTGDTEGPERVVTYALQVCADVQRLSDGGVAVAENVVVMRPAGWRFGDLTELEQLEAYDALEEAGRREVERFGGALPFADSDVPPMRRAS